MTTLIITCAMGIESILARELKALGYTSFKTDNGKIEIQGSLSDIPRCNLWLRTAGRVYLKIAEFEATTFDELFEKTKQVPWSDWIGKNDQFPISKVSSKHSTLFAKSDSQSVVKKAIVDALKSQHATTTLPETGTLYPIRIQIERDQVTLSIDTTGDGLHKRGYRKMASMAPLRETLAASLIYLSRWNPEKDVLLDPFCGSGSILIEAGLMAHNIAPGLNRTFISESWDAIPAHLWDDCRQDAKSKIKTDISPAILGSDIDGNVLTIARENSVKAGLNDIFFQKLDIKDCGSKHQYGKIITNPPYGERLGEEQDAEQLYRCMGTTFRKTFPHWDYYILTPHLDFEKVFNKRSTKNRKLFNGTIQCYFYSFFRARQPATSL
jgi:putative N6-adenine-specific DNA methylase